MAGDVEAAKAALWRARIAEAKNLELRFILLLEALTNNGEHGAWASLEVRTGVSAQRWRGAYARRQRPTPDMIEAACSLVPQYAFWLAVGNLPNPSLIHMEPPL